MIFRLGTWKRIERPERRVLARCVVRKGEVPAPCEWPNRRVSSRCGAENETRSRRVLSLLLYEAENRPAEKPSRVLLNPSADRQVGRTARDRSARREVIAAVLCGEAITGGLS